MCRPASQSNLANFWKTAATPKVQRFKRKTSKSLQVPGNTLDSIICKFKARGAAANLPGFGRKSKTCPVGIQHLRAKNPLFYYQRLAGGPRDDTGTGYKKKQAMTSYPEASLNLILH